MQIEKWLFEFQVEKTMFFLQPAELCEFVWSSSCCLCVSLGAFRIHVSKPAKKQIVSGNC